MFNNKLLYACMFFISYSITAMQLDCNFSYTPTNLMAGYKHMCITPPQKSDQLIEIDLYYDNKFDLLQFTGDRFVQKLDGGSQGKEIFDFLKKLEQIGIDNSDFDHITLTLFDKDKNNQEINTEMFSVSMSSINQVLSNFTKSFESPRRMPNNSYNQQRGRFEEAQRGRFEEAQRGRFEEEHSSESDNNNDNVLTYMNVLQNKGFSSVTFSCQEKTQMEYESASLSYTDHSLIFTLKNGITYFCDKISYIQEILNDLQQLFSDDPEKIILVEFHDEQKLNFSDSYTLSEDDIQKAIAQFNTEVPKPFKQTLIKPPVEEAISSSQSKPTLWQRIIHHKHIVIYGSVAAAVATFVGLWYVTIYKK